jgi:hypothetical protein
MEEADSGGIGYLASFGHCQVRIVTLSPTICPSLSAGNPEFATLPMGVCANCTVIHSFLCGKNRNILIKIRYRSTGDLTKLLL